MLEAKSETKANEVKKAKQTERNRKIAKINHKKLKIFYKDFDTLIF
jgi:hypothetical protein